MLFTYNANVGIMFKISILFFINKFYLVIDKFYLNQIICLKTYYLDLFYVILQPLIGKTDKITHNFRTH